MEHFRKLKYMKWQIELLKEIGYNPVGHQTATLSFSMSAENMDAGIYTIPRYSNINVAGINYSLTTDLSFSKVENTIKEEKFEVFLIIISYIREPMLNIQI